MKLKPLRFLSLLFIAALAVGDSAVKTADLLSAYAAKHTELLQRYVTLETKVDGLSPEFRRTLGDRKSSVTSTFSGKSVALSDKALVQVVITERKRLESEIATLKQWQEKPFVLDTYQKKIAAALLRLEMSELVLSYIEYVDQFNRGEKEFPYQGDPRNRGYFMNLGAATLVGIDYSAARKAKMAYANPAILALNPNESLETKALLESGLGKFDADSLSLSRGPASEGETLKRVAEGEKILKLLGQLTTAYLIINKPFADEYQYHLLKYKKALEQRK